MQALKPALKLCLTMNTVFSKSSDFCITHYISINEYNIPQIAVIV